MEILKRKLSPIITGIACRASLLLVCLLLLTGVPARAADSQKLIKLKAAFVLNFIRYATWPTTRRKQQQKRGHLLLAVPDKADYRKAFAPLTGQAKGKLAIKVIFFSSRKPLPACDALYVPADYRKHWQHWRKQLKGTPVLRVGNLKDFTDNGGMIGLIVKHDLMRFTVNLDRVNESGLKLSSRLLKLARIVRDKKTPPGKQNDRNSPKKPRDNPPAKPRSADHAKHRPSTTNADKPRKGPTR